MKLTKTKMIVAIVLAAISGPIVVSLFAEFLRFITPDMLDVAVDLTVFIVAAMWLIGVGGAATYLFACWEDI